MAATISTLNVDMNSVVAKTLFIEIQLVGMRSFRLRWWLGTRILRFGCWVAGGNWTVKD